MCLFPQVGVTDGIGPVDLEDSSHAVSGVCLASVNFLFKSLLLLQFPLVSFKTRYNYSLGHSSNFLLRILKLHYFIF